MDLPTGDERDPRVLLGRLIERIDQTNIWFGEWMHYIHNRFEWGAAEMSALRAEIAELRGHQAHHRPEPENEKPKGLVGSITDLLKSGKEFLEAVASLKELVLAVAILVASTAVITHPQIFRDLIATYSASGHAEHE
ncbi:hypothetical protein [Hyphomicrobium sp. ghe19]|uniref:hypothetical protein n=1 Tax=Hyphomicrobium sp. ghe19 TaxID=2682968 RepID=UPI0013670A53|nr:hypothetical protein HYPP_03752 [Hyphomicrobium sp. ghe19]